jgi:copper resistance protein C
MTRVTLRLLAATVAACVALLLGAAPAFAHTRLESSDPGDKSSVDAAPASVSLTFNEAISAEFATLSVVGPDGTNYQSGPVSAANGQVSTAVSPLGPAGVYEIGYRVVSDDGHPVSGKVSFTLTTACPGAAAAPAAAPTAAAAPAPAPAAAAATTAVDPQADSRSSEGAPIWPWLVGAVILVAAGAAVALRLSRRS